MIVIEIKRVPISVVDESTALPGKLGRQDKWKPIIDAVRETPKRQAVAITVDPVPGKELKRVARTMQQAIITAGKRHKYEVQVRLHQDYHTIYVVPKPGDTKPDPRTVDTLSVKYGNDNNQLVILNADEIKAKDAELQQALNAFAKKPFGVQKGKLEQFLHGKGIAFVEESFSK